MSLDKLFQPLQVGTLTLPHRIIMAPLTRFRADSSHVPSPHAAIYYAQRAVVPGTLLITEATYISPRACGFDDAPGIWNDAQVAAWKGVTEAVHAKGSYIYCQLWALGRVASKEVIEREGGEVVGPSAVPMEEGSPVPRALAEEEIWAYVREYAEAARRAMEAGFDGVEIHGANGYLIDQFIQDVSNHRTDAWGGSIPNRTRLVLEVTRAVIAAVGSPAKVGLRLSPWATHQCMGMADPVPQFTNVISSVKPLGLAYLHLIESRKGYNTTAADGDYHELTRENDPFVQLWGRDRHAYSALLLAGGFTVDKAKKVVEEVYTEDNVGIAFGRYFISTPDLVYRLRKGLELTPYDRKLFYSKGPKGYVDYPWSKEWEQESVNVSA